MKRLVLKLDCPGYSEVDGSAPRAAARVQRESPFWHSLLPLIPG